MTTTAMPVPAGPPQLRAVLERIRGLRPLIAERAEEIERLRTVPPGLVAAITESGAFRLSVPRRYGGEGLSVPDLVRALIELARADGSVGWLAALSSGVPLVLSRLPLEAFELVYGESPDTLVRGAIAPKGTARSVPGGYLVTGRWPFMSGQGDTDWYCVNCVVTDQDGAPRKGPDGIPQVRIALLPADDVELLDTWHVLGLRGTASHDAAVSERFVPEARTASPFGGAPCLDEPELRIPLRTAFAPRVAATAVGIARGAFDELTALAVTKRPAMRPAERLAQDAVFQHRLGEAHQRLAAAEALLVQESSALWQAPLGDDPECALDIVRPRAMAGFVVAECTAVVDMLYTAGGGSTVFDSSPLQRRLRDIHTLTQHMVATTENYRPLGSLLVGEPVPAALLR